MDGDRQTPKDELKGIRQASTVIRLSGFGKSSHLSAYRGVCSCIFIFCITLRNLRYDFDFVTWHVIIAVKVWHHHRQGMALSSRYSIIVFKVWHHRLPGTALSTRYALFDYKVCTHQLKGMPSSTKRFSGVSSCKLE